MDVDLGTYTSTIVVNANNYAADDTIVPSRGVAGGNDVIYGLTVTTAGSYDLTLSADFPAVLALGPAPGGTPELDCRDAFNNPPTLFTASLTPGDYLVVVEGYA